MIEEDLKAGRIPCLVATSSLELGIDMGAVDLVIQVESPKSVARGLQRVGRAGHELGSTSKGRIFPKFRADLLESAVVARAMRGGEIEETKIPRNPLDVLAQQIVAIVADEEIEVDGAAPARARRVSVLRPLARSSSRTCSTCSPAAIRRTSSPSCGRGSSGTEPRGVSAAVRALGGSPSRTPARSPTAASTASTWSTAAAASASSTRRWSTRRGRARRSCSAPRPGGSRRSPATACSSRRRPASRAQCRSGRAKASADRSSWARRSGAPRASWSRSRRRRARSTHLRDDYHLDPRAAQNLLAFLREQAAATGVVPTDRSIVVERFRDEIGDWRVCILTPFGGRVHAPWGMALTARLRDSLGLDAQSIWSDDGIALHLPEADAPPSLADLLIGPDEIEELVVGEVGQTALFGARFRENAARALLIPRRRPGQRTPLWQQRLKAQNLLQVARKYGSFPIVLETYRECLQDVFDLPALKNDPHGPADARARSRRGRDGVGLAVRQLAPVRLRRHLHVRGRHAAGRAAGAGALARPRAAPRAARPGGAARADRSRRARRGRAAARAASRAIPTSSTTCCAAAATCAAGEYDEASGGDPARGAPCAAGARSPARSG